MNAIAYESSMKSNSLFCLCTLPAAGAIASASCSGSRASVTGPEAALATRATTTAACARTTEDWVVAEGT